MPRNTERTGHASTPTGPGMERGLRSGVEGGQRAHHVLPFRLAERGGAEARALVVAGEAVEGHRAIRRALPDPRGELAGGLRAPRREPPAGPEPARPPLKSGGPRP